MRCVGAWLRLDPSSGGGGGLLSPGELQRSQVRQQWLPYESTCAGVCEPAAPSGLHAWWPPSWIQVIGSGSAWLS